MTFYIHIGCELNGSDESILFIDRWIHLKELSRRLEILKVVLEL